MKTSRILSNGLLALILSSALGCSSSEDCSGAACAGPAGSGGGTNAECTTWVDANTCVATDDCPTEPSAEIVPVASIATRTEANPEIVDMVAGTDDRAVVISSVANQISELVYTATSLDFGREEVIDTGSDTANMSSVKVAPSGKFAAVTVSSEECAKGEVLFVDIDVEFGKILGRTTVGYTPDSGAFSKDGKFFVTVDEDDREDHPCKPADRAGGSVTVIDLAGGPASPVVAQTIAVDHALDSEPEGIAISGDGTVAIAIQETSEVGFFSLDDVPNAELELVSLDVPAGPDAIAISKDDRWALVGLEYGDSLAVFDLASRTLAHRYVIAGSGDVPDTFNRDTSEVTNLHEPEGVVFFHQQGQLFAGVALQESHAVALYAVAEDGSLSFDSIAPSGIGFSAEENGREKSGIGPEGLAVNERAGALLVANEREGSITLFKTAATAPCESAP